MRLPSPQGDFTRLVAACPEAFALEWVAFSEARNRTTTVQSQRLSVAVAEHWPPGRPGSRVSVAQRLEAFRCVAFLATAVIPHVV